MARAQTPTVGATVSIKVGGLMISADLEQNLEEFVLEDSIHLPDLLELRFADPNTSYPQGTPFEIGKPLVATIKAPGSKDAEFTAEITGLSLRIVEGMYVLVVRAMDKLHRMNRGSITKTFEQMTASDIFRKLADMTGAEVGSVDATSTTYPMLSIVNEAALPFLRRLAADNDRIITSREGKVNMIKRHKRASSVTLAPGESLQELDAHITATDLTQEVIARGWDVQNKQKTEARERAASISIAREKGDVAALSTALGGDSLPLVLASPTLSTDAEATEAAKSAASVLGGATAELHGRCTGEPLLRAGGTLALTNLPPAFAGEYIVTSTRHVVNVREGYSTEFSVSADQDRSLLGLVAAGRGQRGSSPSGVVPGIVTQVEDPDELGRVRVRFPWAAEDHESAWARVAHPMAGKDRGAIFMPKIDDEVLCAFEHDDPSRPYVVGSLYNGKDVLPDQKGDLLDGGDIVRRGIYTEKLELSMDDTDGSQKLGLGMRDGTYAVTIDKGGTTITVTSDGTVQIQAKDKVMVTSKSDIEIKATSKLSFEAQGAVSIKGMGIEIVDQAGASLKLQGTAALKGATVAIN